MKIIAQSPIIKPCPITSRGCIVIREDDKTYVVHNAQADEDGSLTSFYWGHYFRKDRPDALDRATLDFVGRVLRWHCLHITHKLVPVEGQEQETS
jgi:hypothetical protein